MRESHLDYVCIYIEKVQVPSDFLKISVLILKILDKDGQAGDTGTCVGEVHQSTFVSLRLIFFLQKIYFNKLF